MGYLAWTDTVGSATLSNLKPKPARRFKGWTPNLHRESDMATALGTGMGFDFLFRRDYEAGFAYAYIPITETETVHRFQDYALAGCAFYLYTEDASDRVHVVRLKPGTIPKISQESDAGNVTLELRIEMEVISAADPPEPLLCFYRE